MANVLIEETTMGSIADAIRAKNGYSKQYLPNEMAKGIGAINGNAYQIALDNGFVGSLDDWMESLRGPKGEDGSVVFEELTPEQMELLRGPKGDKGDTGDKGSKGDKGDTGDKGDKGDKGDAFTYDDFTEEQLEALRGPAGQDGTVTFESLTDEQKEEIRGPAGAAGFSPTVTVTTVTNGHIVNITTADGEESFLVSNGTKGDKGDKGDTGEQGPAGPKGDTGPAYTLTAADKSSIVNSVLAALPNYEGVSF